MAQRIVNGLLAIFNNNTLEPELSQRHNNQLLIQDGILCEENSPPKHAFGPVAIWLSPFVQLFFFVSPAQRFNQPGWQAERKRTAHTQRALTLNMTILQTQFPNSR